MNDKPDFFISYTQTDQPWADWIAWILEAADYRVTIALWDFVPGSNWPERMDDMARDEVSTIAILSPDYLGSRFGKAEWLAAWRTGTEGGQRKLIPVKVADCRTSGLLAGIVFVDLVGLSEADAERELGTKIPAAISGRAKPTAKPKFPGATRTFKKKPQFPGPDGTNAPPPSPSTFPPPGNRASHTALPISARPQRLWLAAIAAILVALAVIIVFHALSTYSPTTPGSGRTTGLATPSTEPAVASSGPPLSQSTVKTSNAAPTSSPLPSGDVTLRNVATENCADSTSSGDVFTYACNRASSQQWSALPVSGSVYALRRHTDRPVPDRNHARPF